MRRRTESSRPQPRGKRAVDASVEDLGGSLAEYASVEEVKSDLDRLRAEDDEILHPGSRKPASIAKRQTRRKLSDFAGILSPEAVQELRKAASGPSGCWKPSIAAMMQLSWKQPAERRNPRA